MTWQGELSICTPAVRLSPQKSLALPGRLVTVMAAPLCWSPATNLQEESAIQNNAQNDQRGQIATDQHQFLTLWWSRPRKHAHPGTAHSPPIRCTTAKEVLEDQRFGFLLPHQTSSSLRRIFASNVDGLPSPHMLRF